MTDDDHLSAEFISENGRVMTRRQIGYAAWKRGAVVTPTDDSILVDGDLFTPGSDRPGIGLATTWAERTLARYVYRIALSVSVVKAVSVRTMSVNTVSQLSVAPA